MTALLIEIVFDIVPLFLFRQCNSLCLDNTFVHGFRVYAFGQAWVALRSAPGYLRCAVEGKSRVEQTSSRGVLHVDQFVCY